MLDACASGWKKAEKTHNFIVTFGGKTYPGLPKKHSSVEIGHIRHMARLLGILDCAKTQIELMR